MDVATCLAIIIGQFFIFIQFVDNYTDLKKENITYFHILGFILTFPLNICMVSVLFIGSKTMDLLFKKPFS